MFLFQDVQIIVLRQGLYVYNIQANDSIFLKYLYSAGPIIDYLHFNLGLICAVKWNKCGHLYVSAT